MEKSGAPLTFDDLAQAVGWEDLPEIPPSIDLNLIGAALAYDFANSRLLIEADSETYGSAVFIATSVKERDKSGGQEASKWAFLVGLAEEKGLNLSDLPLVGKELSRFETVGFQNIQVLVSSAPFDANQTETLNRLLAAGHFPALLQTIVQGVSLGATLQLGSTEYPLALQLGKGPKVYQIAMATGQGVLQAPIVGDEHKQTGVADGKWFNVQKKLGPVTFERIGVRYGNGELYFMIDASFSLAGLTLELAGLAAGSRLDRFEPHFYLDGFGLSYSNETVTIGGAFLAHHDSPDSYRYDGLAMIRVKPYTFAAVGSFGYVDGNPSLFLFAEVGGKMGGPPYLYLSGLMGGFGINRNLRMPNHDEVADFPFIRGLTNPQAVGGKGPQPLAVLRILDQGSPGKPPWITPQIGQYWLAAGVSVTIVELIKAKVLLVGIFGQEFQFGVLGLAHIKLPPEEGSTTFAMLELMIEAVIKPAEGFVGVSAMLSRNSFLLDPNCRLTGGFALHLWLLGPHQGDFVLTAGGYHPQFQPPAWYPQVPRVGFSWTVDDYVSIKGGLYFAVTPACVMAGGELEILFQAGNLNAWLIAQAHFLMDYQPFHFAATVGVRIGVSYRLDFLGISKTFRVELSASLDLWGPPTGGQAKIEWWVVSHTVRFGQDRRQEKEKLDWSEFRQMLPPEGLCRVQVLDGLLRQDGETWVVRADEFKFKTESSLPSQSVVLADSREQTVAANQEPLHIRPMQAKNVKSRQVVRIVKRGANNFSTNDWVFGANKTNVPAALWGEPVDQAQRVPSAQVLSGYLTGITGETPAPHAGGTPGMIDTTRHLQFEELACTGLVPLSAASAPVADLLQIERMSSARRIADTVMSDEVQNNRARMADLLRECRLFEGVNGALDQLAAEADQLFVEAPYEVKE